MKRAAPQIIFAALLIFLKVREIETRVTVVNEEYFRGEGKRLPENCVRRTERYDVHNAQEIMGKKVDYSQKSEERTIFLKKTVDRNCTKCYDTDNIRTQSKLLNEEMRNTSN